MTHATSDNTTTQIKLEILISGGGIAGPCLAWWLHKANFPAQITIVERSPTPRTSGQAVDIRDAAVDVIKAMDLEATIREYTTTEEGTDIVYADGVTKASFPATGDDSVQSFTSEFEILRGDLARILYEATKEAENVKYVFDEYISDIQQPQDGEGQVKVKFANGHLPETDFDLVVGADGMISKVRRLVFGHGPNGNEYLRRLGQYTSFFTIPRTPFDTKFSQWYFAAKGRLAVTRPSRYGDTRAYLAVTDSDMSRFDGIAKAMKEGPEAQQKWIAEQFEGAGWETERIVEGMKKSEDFYMQEIAQVKIERFAKGRVALLGDAGYCPSPISGLGTTTALVGAFVLAGELSNSPSDIPKALDRYQTTLRPFVDLCQKLPPGAPQIANPQSDWGVRIVDTLAGAAANPLVKRFGSVISWLVPQAFTGKKWQVPHYTALVDSQA